MSFYGIAYGLLALYALEIVGALAFIILFPILLDKLYVTLFTKPKKNK